MATVVALSVAMIKVICNFISFSSLSFGLFAGPQDIAFEIVYGKGSGCKSERRTGSGTSSDDRDSFVRGDKWTALVRALNLGEWEHR